MIVPMKKVSLVVIDSSRQRSLEALRGLGVLHLETRDLGSNVLEGHLEKRNRLSRALQIIPLPKQEKKKSDSSVDISMEESLELADHVSGLSDREREIREELSRWTRESARLQAWGDFSPADILDLENAGISVKLLEMNESEYKALPEGASAFTVSAEKDRMRVAVILDDPESEIPGQEFLLPALGLSQIRDKQRDLERDLQAVSEELLGFVDRRGAFERRISEIDEQMEFETARVGMSQDGPLAYLVGYAPEEAVDGVLKLAREQQWAVLVEEPAEEDPVPTLVRNPKWVRIVSPVLKFLGIVPGYWEHDISLWFLLFFSVFFAMIIGDAGYGCIFLLLSVVGKLRFRRSGSLIFFLLMVTSVCTVGWGAITGTWFGSRILASSESPLSYLVIDSIASFPPSGTNVVKTVMHLCFIIGAVHLTIAHVVSFISRLPKIVAFAQLGWLSILWGMYFLVRLIVVENGDFGILQSWFPGPWLLAAGLGLIIIFDEQKGSFFKGLGLGLAKLPLKLLNSISSFSDIISYVRLFAVGLATLEVAKAFNSMAEGMGFNMPAGLGAAFILFFGHTLNIVMGALSLIVHGVRLNVLEFSSHLGMEWSGISYRPFQNQTKE